MQRRVGAATIESITAEHPKFTAPLLLVHGLWCTAAMWRPFMGYLAHRGWSCHAVSLPGRVPRSAAASVGMVSLADCIEQVRQAMRRCEATPVLVGHDLGALLALHSALPAPRAVVALAPLVPPQSGSGRRRLIPEIWARLAMRRAAVMPLPRRGAGIDYREFPPPGGTVPDSGRLAREVTDGGLRVALRCAAPTLMLVGAGDRVSPAPEVQRLAAAIGAVARVVADGGHALPWAPGWEQRVSEVHRWLVQTLGEDLLVPADDGET